MTHFEFKCSGRSVKHLCASWKKYIDRHTIHTSTFPQLQVKAKGLSSEAMSNKARIRHTLLRFGLRMMDIDLAVACFPESPSYRDKTHGAGNWLIWFEMNVYCTHTHTPSSTLCLQDLQGQLEIYLQLFAAQSLSNLIKP